MPGTCSVIVPTYNEEGNIVNMAKALRELYPDFYIFFMDDNSTDNSKKLIDELGDPKTKLVTRKPEERGLAASCFQGIIECGTDYFMTIDCDFQHPPSALADEYKKLEEGCDLVVGTRNERLKGLGFVRWAGSWTFNLIADVYLFRLRKAVTEDVMSGLYAGRCDVFVPVIKEHWNELEMTGWKVLMDLLKYGPRDIKIGKINYDFGKRTEGESHISPKVVITTCHQMGRLGKLAAKVLTKLIYNE